tara:strand:+ start:1019 stop:1243 length:225 start_codon:yes stop_codon:yes gene_type:complete
MITNQKIEVDKVYYSRFSKTLQFNVVANSDAIRTLEDIVGRTDMTMEEIAEEMGNLLQKVLIQDYSRGGMRIKY